MENLVSVIMPTFNRAETISKAIQSVYEQTYKNWELIIIDDASTDNTEDIVKTIDDERIKYVKNECNRGANFSRNYGCKMAQGEYLAFLDSDNYWLSEKLEKQVQVLRSSSEKVAFVFCQIKLFNDEKVRVIPDDKFCIGNVESIMKKYNVIDTNAVLMKRDVFEKMGGFDESMPRLQDYDLFYNVIVIHHYEVKYMAEILDHSILQPNSISRDASRFTKAMFLFIEKYHKYMNDDEIVIRLRTLIDSIENSIEWNTYINRLQAIDGLFTPALCVELLKQYSIQTRYYETLFSWKEEMEKNKLRTIFPSRFFNDDFVIAIYGLGRWGEAIYSELNNVGIQVSVGIDKKVEDFHDIKVIKPAQISEKIDIIIVSVFQHYEDIKKELAKYFGGEIVSIEELIVSNIKK